jgi:hypothetical protein
MVEVEPAVGELLPELRHRLDPQVERVAEAIECVPARHGRGVEFEDRAHV